jgi:pyruvate dehydrogenase E2 component (dihydrolipoamide acetyltransferase)
MAKNVILPALGIAQETGTILRWLKTEGDSVTQGEPLAEIETDKATVEIEAPAPGILSSVSASVGDEVPVGQVIAIILAPGEVSSARWRPLQNGGIPLVETQKAVPTAIATSALTPASPKARRLAAEYGQDITSLRGSGPDGAVLAADVLAAARASHGSPIGKMVETTIGKQDELTIGTIWRVMAERTTQSWTSVPHFFLVREVRANRLIAWREQAQKRSGGPEKITYTDLLVRVVASLLREHPRINASWSNGKIQSNNEINIGLAIAVEEGLVVPVVHRADALNLGEIAQRRRDLVNRAHGGRLRPQDMSGGTFTISNLGMYGVDAFNAIINAPQAAILAVGRIAERIVPANGQAVVQPTMILSLSCDHRVIDGARGAQFLGALAELIEEPLGLLS